MEINGIPVNEIDEVADILHKCKSNGYKSVKILMSHPEITSGLTSKGIRVFLAFCLGKSATNFKNRPLF
jgi:hypothetical protein